jgi:hypothetical protein
MLLAVVLIGGVAFDVGREAMHPGESADVLTVSQRVSQDCVGLNILSCNALVLSVQKGEGGLYAVIVFIVALAGLALWLVVRRDARP